ncbi:hypothetical protein KIN20_021426 [Parelaphostrongylus tenuis]|uniref:Uncharacterized protein n=1 Tax=Parelaphostrongylus tenuis TaxID=148309 RepID=A0AAD5N581_PARTN|nr:hypothetical protein KIN20_021426 [Parelaphostrongylus tenuis]
MISGHKLYSGVNILHSKTNQSQLISQSQLSCIPQPTSDVFEWSLCTTSSTQDKLARFSNCTITVSAVIMVDIAEYLLVESKHTTFRIVAEGEWLVAFATRQI